MFEEFFVILHRSIYWYRTERDYGNPEKAALVPLIVERIQMVN